MGLTIHALDILRPHLKPGAKVLQLGYQDLVAPVEYFRDEYGIEVVRTTANNRWHGVDYPLPDTEEVFVKLGCEITCVDIVQVRGCEILCDLNDPPTHWALAPGQYDVVIDGGTLEHCFNVGRAMMTAADAVKVGGVIFHWNPLTMINHGFWNFSPTVYSDFYEQNGWVLSEISAFDRSRSVKLPAKKRFSLDPEFSICVTARRTGMGLRFPTQRKYLDNPMLRRVDAA